MSLSAKNDRIQPVGLGTLKKKHTAAAPATENFGLSTPGEGQGLGTQRQAMFDCWKAGMAAPVSGACWSFNNPFPYSAKLPKYKRNRFGFPKCWNLDSFKLGVSTRPF